MATTKRDTKQSAQDNLMYAAQSAFYRLGDDRVSPDDPVYIETVRQFRRMEKFFGYKPDSWGLG